jgi:PAS domain S-box-containing protein
MEAVWLTAYRALLLLSVVVGLFLCYQAVIHRDKPGAKPLLILVTGSLLYVSVKFAVSVVRGTPTVFVFTRFNPLGAGLAAVGFFLLVIEYTGVENPVSKRTATGVVLVPAVVSVLAWVDLTYFWVPVSDGANTLSGYAWEVTSVALLNQLYLNLLLLAGIGLLVRWGIRSPNRFTVQVRALVLAAMGPLGGNLVFQFGYVPVNPTPIMFVASGALIAWAILQAGFLDLIPIGRDTVLDQFDASVVTLDGNHRVVDINECGCRLFGVDDADTVVGDHIDELLADHPPFRERYWTVADSDSGQDSALESGGRHYTVEVVRLSTAQETTLGRSIIVRDITDQKRREQELEELNTRFELALEETDTGVWDWDLETDDIIWDEATERLFGYEPGEFPGTFEAIADRVHDDDIPKVRTAIDRSLETGEEYRTEFRVQPPDGDQRWVQTRGVVKTDDNGMPTRMLGIQTEITEWKHRERELAAARESAETIIEASPVPIWVQGLEEIRYANDAAAELFGLDDADALVGSSALSYVPEEQRERARERNLRMLEDDDRLPEMTGKLITTDGETREALFAAAPVQYHGARSIVTIATDITERRERERELRETKAQLEQSNEKLDQFAGVVSHDLRNPLNAAQLRLDLLRGEDGDGHAEAAGESLDRMETMIEDLLQLSRAGETVENPEKVPLTDVVRESWRVARTGAADLDLTALDSTVVLADRDRLRQVFENLFRNAADHNDSAVTVRVGLLGEREAIANGGQRSGFFVEDDGVGIPPDERDEIFEHGYTTSPEGTGFGLSIVRNIVEAHGWEIRVIAGADGGTRFEISSVDTDR